ncbi:major royal jelly protein 2-like [Phymastichus coffea]|uniref:major royal jelly protein 2-like n=1 Tax=Phymastichus coffea TaxID=108790 RepID=UPI00273BEC7B|nr:major royal jelly protein 2-like [Phymastichus coffea]
METVHTWKYIDFLWQSKKMRQQAISSGDYNYTQMMPMDVDQASDGRIFVSFNGQKGVPAVLGTVTRIVKYRSGPLIKPYPNWSWFKKNDCNYMQNVYRIAIDECQRLWVLDTGSREESKEEVRVECDPKLFVFDLKTDTLISKIIIPKEYALGSNNLTLLATPIVETSGHDCSDTTVYMANVLGQAMVIWNNGKWSRLEHPVFDPVESAANITSGGNTIEWNAGIVTMDLSPEFLPGEPRQLYFHSLASFDLNWADAGRLKRSSDGSDVDYYSAKNVLSSQAVGVAFSSEGTLFMGLPKEAAIACYNKYRDLKPVNVQIITQDSKRMQYINGMKTIRNPRTNKEELIVISNRLIAFEFDKLNFKDYNFHILKKSVEELVVDTECALPDEIRRKKYDSMNPNNEELYFFGKSNSADHKNNNVFNHVYG